MPSYRAQYVRCGNKRCKSCPHGPYWYSYWKEEGKTRSKYHGKADPRDGAGRDTRAGVSPFDAIFDRRSASLDLACAILQVPVGADQAVAKRAFLRLTMEHHPDRGGTTLAMQRIEAAWSFLKSYHGWSR
jgi:hypothetical protein